MGIRYAVPFSAVAVTAQQDFFEINASSTRSLILHSIYITQNSDAGDAQDEMLSVLIKTGATTSGSGGTAPTPQPLGGSGTAQFTAEVNNTTKATAGTIVTKHADSFNVRAGWYYRPTPEERIELLGGGRLTVELATTPADSLTMNGTAIVEEIG